QVAGPTDRLGAGLLEARPPPAQGHLADAELAGAVSPTQPLGPVRLRLLQQRANVLRVQPPTHTSLRNNSANAHYPWTSFWGADHTWHISTHMPTLSTIFVRASSARRNFLANSKVTAWGESQEWGSRVALCADSSPLNAGRPSLTRF